jgi:hypothetical protein
MPMMPGPLAALSYCAVKVVGYAFYGKSLNAKLGLAVPPYRFGFGKTAIGLVGGLIYVFLIAPRFGRDTSDWILFLGAAPIRIAAWAIALAFFYKLHKKPLIFAMAIFAGLIWTYFLDGVMWAIYQIVPGMAMPIC